MSTADAMTGISSAISLLGLVVLVFWLYRQYRIDAFRQEMFAVRDELFDFADAGHVPFESSAYGMLRATMNGYIRFGHRASLLHVLLFAAAAKREASRHVERDHDSFNAKWTASASDLPRAERAELEKFRTRMDRLVVKHVLLNSPLLVALVIPAIIAYFLAEVCANWIASVFAAEIDSIDSVALSYGRA